MLTLIEARAKTITCMTSRLVRQKKSLAHCLHKLLSRKLLYKTNILIIFLIKISQTTIPICCETITFSTVHDAHSYIVFQKRHPFYFLNNSETAPSGLWHCWLGNRKGIRPVKKLGVGLLVVMIWLELCMAYSSSCHHHLHHPLLQWILVNPGSPGKWPLKRRERDTSVKCQSILIKFGVQHHEEMCYKFS